MNAISWFWRIQCFSSNPDKRRDGAPDGELENPLTYSNSLASSRGIFSLLAKPICVTIDLAVDIKGEGHLKSKEVAFHVVITCSDNRMSRLEGTDLHRSTMPNPKLVLFLLRAVSSVA